jgi:aconitate decarboxylase
MQERHPFGPDDVERFVVHGSQVTVDHVGWKYKPEGLTSAQLNLPFCVATYMLEGDCFVEQFTEDCVADPARMAFSERVETQHDPAITAKGAAHRHLVRVETFLKDGTHMEETVESARGSEHKFASEADVVEKFEKLAKHALPKKQIDALKNAILNMEDLKDAMEIPKLLAKG